MSEDSDYRLQHRAPTDDGYSAPLSDALTRFGPDVLERPDLYGTADEETVAQMAAAVADPSTLVRIYRAVPPEHPQINRGDWVTLSRPYAHDHGHVNGAQDWPVIYADVPAASVWTDGNDPSEYGYDGPDLSDLVPYAEGATMAPPAPFPGRQAHDLSAFHPSPGARAERRQPPSPSPPATAGHPVGR